MRYSIRSRPSRTAAAFFVLLVIVMYGFFYFLIQRCGSKEISAVWSPDGVIRARIVRRFCHGATDMGGISLGRPGGVGPGNVLQFPAQDLPKVSIYWESRRVLVIRHPPTMPVYARQSSFIVWAGKVTIKEQMTPATVPSR